MTPQEVRDARSALNMTQEELEHALGLSNKGRTVRAWESGESHIGGASERALQYLLAYGPLNSGEET